MIVKTEAENQSLLALTKSTPFDSVTIDYERAGTIFPELISVFVEKRHPFRQYSSIFVEPFLPPGFPTDPLFRSRYYFALCLYMKGNIESPVAQQRLSRLAVDEPDLFDPDYWADRPDHERNVERLVGHLKDRGLGAGVDKYHRKHWPYNFRKLRAHHGGDPRRIFQLKQGWTFDGLLKSVRNYGAMSPENPSGFFGFQRKMVALWAHFGVEVGSVDPEKMLYPLPVDIHVARVLLNTGVLKVIPHPSRPAGEKGWKLGYHKVVTAGIEVSLRYLMEVSGNAWTAAEAFWNYGMEMCALRPADWRTLGPEDGRASVLVCNPPPDTAHQRRRHGATCLVCPVREYCDQSLSIGSKPYFLQGVLAARPAPFPAHWPTRLGDGDLMVVPPTHSGGKMGRWWRQAHRPHYEPRYRVLEARLSEADPRPVQDDFLQAFGTLAAKPQPTS